MPFGAFQSDKVVPFRVGDLLRAHESRPWVHKRGPRGEAARQISVALQWYWMNSESRFLPKDYAIVVDALAQHAPPLLKALDAVTDEKSLSNIYYQVDSFVGLEGGYMRDLHLALKRVGRAAENLKLSKENSRTLIVRNKDGSTQKMSASQKNRVREAKSAAKSVAKLIDPAGHALAFKLIAPFMLISSSLPSAEPKSHFARFVAEVEELFIRRVAEEMSRQHHDLANPEAIARKRYGMFNRDASVRWAADEWKRTVKPRKS